MLFRSAFILWPLFGCTNQLLGALALLVITVYLALKKTPVYCTVIPMLFMLVMTGWAMLDTIKNLYLKNNILLLVIGIIIFALEIWMVFESILVMKKIRGSAKNILETND